MDMRSQPIELFTTNRWVTGERWLPAEDLIPCVRAFGLENHNPFSETREWLAAMLTLFRPQIEKLIVDRDERIECWKRNVSGDAFEDRDLNRVSRASIDIVAQVAAIEHKLGIKDAG